MSGITGHRKLQEQLEADGVRYMFGNPGSSEEGLLDEIARCPAIGSVLGLQEAAIGGIADGYAQATQRPAVVQLHCSVGPGNAIASLYHAKRRRSPLLVIAGESGPAYDAMDAQMAADLVASFPTPSNSPNTDRSHWKRRGRPTWYFGLPIPASASAASKPQTSSSPSNRPTTRRPAALAAPASAWPSPRAWSA